jgi:pepF/M3 family oligoendopeptidase
VHSRRCQGLASAKLGNLPHWDLTNVYPGLESEQFKTAAASLQKQVDAIDGYLSERRVFRTSPSPDVSVARMTIDGYLERMNETLRSFTTLSAYVASFVTTDSYNTTAKRLESELETVGVRLRKQDILFQGYIGSMAEILPQVLADSGTAKEHAFYLKETAEQSRYMMSDAEESLAAELDLSGGNAWSKLQGTVSSQLIVVFELDGKTQKMPITALQNLKHHPDAEVRRRAYETELAAWESVREPLAASMNGVKGEVVTLNKRRGRTDALHESIDKSRLDRQTLETMLEVMRESFPVFRRYFKAKSRKLGNKGALPWWDVFAPVGKSDRRYTWDEAKRFVLAQFRSFDDRLVSVAQRAFDHNWIDAEPRDGKRGGAFCMGVPGVDESRVLCNFDGSLDQLSTVAHELGHAFHNDCQVGKKMLQTITPMTLAETASTFNETIIANAAFAQAVSREEKLAILETQLINASQVVVDIYSRFLFEKEVFERREKSELSADDFCEIMIRCQKLTYGDGLDERYLHKYMWAWKPHYYSPGLSFYNYPYAFGLLFGTGLYALYKERGGQFTKDYESLLASTGEGTPAQLAARFGIDIGKPDFWRNSLKPIEQEIEQYINL